MECKCDDYEDANSGWWLGSNSIQMGAFSVVGYLLYRFSQTLPALIRWPIRLFCSLTGLSALWGWVSRLVGTLRVMQNFYKRLSQIWRFIKAILSKFTTGSSQDGALGSKTNPASTLDLSRPGLRLILLGPTGGGRSSLTETLLGNSEPRAPVGPLMESTKRTTIVDGREITVIDTPDLMGLSLGNTKRAREALRSLQLVSPGPHAFLMVIRTPGTSMEVDQDAVEAIQAAMELYGEEVIRHIIPVLTHGDLLGRIGTVDRLLDVDAGHLRSAVSLCHQRPELVDNRPDCPPEAQNVLRRQLVGRVMEMKELQGHFVHELQRREDSLREVLLTDMASALARKLGHV
ncbi:immune-associated nucleotide-binding protein 5-like isoform X2 [Echeneis naucrates]|uniref:immune-associated nucleotide-binding protein 5-like isoform X2 n=1 Tax=Echeneis naucrates TaxID=173247 RepID=UPI00111418DA|nr:immune-associated nucleotide-binding protein 5-like isoform X2 [Echeneis naucrates]